MDLNWAHNFEYIKHTLCAILQEAGGVAIFTAICGFIVHKINTRFERRIENKYDEKIEMLKVELDKQRDMYKSILEKRNHVSKARFDTEFSICKELMMDCKTMIDAIHILFPNIELMKAYSANGGEPFRQEQWSDATDKVNYFSRQIEGNAAFISKEVYDEFTKILNKCKINVYFYLCFNKNDPLFGNLTTSQRTEKLTKAFNNSKELSSMLSNIADMLRQHFQNMDIQE